MRLLRNHHGAPSLALWALLWCVMSIAFAASASGQSTRPGQRGRPVKGLDPIQDAIRRLTAEAESARSNEDLPGGEADFANRFDRVIDAKQLGAILIAPTHRDPFIDAYIRWQLTSFDPPLPEFDDQQFARFMRQAPAMAPNPRADPQVLGVFQRAEEAASLSPRDLQRLRRMTDRLDAQAAQAEALSTPATDFRRWVQQKLGDAGPRPRQWLLERCAATIAAGWSTRSIKARITRDFGASVSDRTFTNAQRRLVAQQAQRLIGLQRKFVNKITFLADGSLNVTFSTGGVDGDDVQRWINRLAGITPG